jgi:hypothetical protein
MRFIKLALSGILGIVVMSSAQAKTSVYDLINLSSGNAQVHYDRLDFFGATSAVVTIDKSPQSPDVTISSVVLNFPTAAKLTATNFKKSTNGTYRAILSDVWVFREVFIDVDGPLVPGSPFHIRGSVSERQSFINPTLETQGTPLFDAIGMLRDITPIQVADTGSTVVNGKTLTLSLQTRLGFDDHQNFGFVISAFWLGKGQKNLVIPFGSPVNPDMFEAITLTIDETPGPNNQQIRFTFRDLNSNSIVSTPSFPLKMFLDQAYGPN